MAIAGFKTIEAPAPAPLFDIDAAVGATVGFYGALDVIGNEAEARESLTKGFTRLTELGLPGRLYVRPPAGIRHSRLLGAAEAQRPSGVPEFYQYEPLWLPGKDPGGYTEAELNGEQSEFEVRLALYSNEPNPHKVDPLLHFKDLSFDDTYREKRKPTQLEEIDRITRVFTAQHPGLTIDTADHRDYAVWVGMDRMRDDIALGDPEFVLNSGFMRVPRLGRRRVDGGSCVGFVRSFDGRAYFDWSSGYAFPGSGVGLSVGVKKG